MTNYRGRYDGKKGRQVYRPIEGSLQGSSGNVSRSVKHGRCTESELVDPDEEIVWNGRNTGLQNLFMLSQRNSSVSKDAENVTRSSSQFEAKLIPLSAQNSQYAVLRDLLEKGSNKQAISADHSGSFSDVKCLNGTKTNSTNKSVSRQSYRTVGSGGGYKYVKKSSIANGKLKEIKEANVTEGKSSVPIENLNKIKKATVSEKKSPVPFKKLNKIKDAKFEEFKHNSLEHKSSGRPHAEFRGQRSVSLFWIACEGIEEGEITVSQPFSSQDQVQTINLGRTEVSVIFVSNNGKRLVNLECVRLLYTKPKASFHLTMDSAASQQTSTEVKSSEPFDSSLLGPYSLLPGSSMSFQLSCTAKVVGYHKAVLLFDLGRHKVLRFANLIAEDEIARALSVSEPYSRMTGKKFQTRGRLVCGPPPPGPRFAKPLGAYQIPRIMERSLLKDRMLPVFLQGLSFDSYQEYFSALIYAEELQCKADIQVYDLQNVTMRPDRRGLLALKVPGLLERRPSVIYRDTVLVRQVGSEKKYQGFVYGVQAEEVLLKFHVSLHQNFILNQRYHVRFSYSRITIRRCLQAIDASKSLERNFLFPSFIPPAINSHDQNFVPVNHLLNEEQKQSVMEILKKVGGPPYLVYGPPGTGKTVTVVEAILQALKLKPNSKILACAPSNAAADVLLDRLRGSIQVMDVLRLNAFTRPLDDVAPELWPYCYSDRSFFCCPSIDKLLKYKVVVSTYYSAAMLDAQGLEQGHFSHIFLDECGQGMEPEALVPLANFFTENTVAVLAGDYQQLGPIIRSSLAGEFGLGCSLLERLSKLPLYSRSLGGGDTCEFNRAVVTKLVRNYRSHPAILNLPSRLFYDGELIACAPQEICNSLCGWEELPNKNFPVLFVGIEGKDEREGTSPSWFNAQEASKVVELLLKLKECRRNRLSDSDIGVISPYNQQVKKIKAALALKNITGIKTGSVEQFQGQERKVIIISTVRSSREFIQSDQLNQIGFLDSPKRFNVAITRAKALLLVIGNPYVLCQDQQWGELLNYCIENKSYIGCTPPTDYMTETTELTDYMDLLLASENLSRKDEDNPDATAFETPWPDPTW